MSKNTYELKHTTILEIENETLRQQVKQLKIRINELEQSVNIRDLALAKHKENTDNLLVQLENILKI